MSDVNVQVEQANQARLASLTRALQINVFISGIGMLVFWVSSLGLYSIWGANKLASLFIFIGMVINAIPIWTKKTSGLFNMAEYEVVTVNNAGTVLSTDSGWQSMQANFFVKLIMLGIMLVVGLVVQPIRIIIMAIKYAVLKRKVKGTIPLLQKGGFLLLLYFLLGFIGICIAHGMVMAHSARIDKEYTARFVKGVTVIIDTKHAELYEEPKYSTKLVKIPQGTRFTINDDPVKDSNKEIYFAAEYQGKKGWIHATDCFAILGTGKITVAQEDIEIYDEQGKYVDTVSVPAGAIVNVGQYLPPSPEDALQGTNKKYRTVGRYYCEYNGIYCAPFADEIEVSPELQKQLGAKK